MSDNPSPLDELERLKAEIAYHTDLTSRFREERNTAAETIHRLSRRTAIDRYEAAVVAHADYLIAAAREREELRASMQRIKEHAAYGDEWSVESGGRYRDILAEAESALELDAAIDAARKGDGG